MTPFAVRRAGDGAKLRKRFVILGLLGLSPTRKWRIIPVGRRAASGTLHSLVELELHAILVEQGLAFIERSASQTAEAAADDFLATTRRMGFAGCACGGWVGVGKIAAIASFSSTGRRTGSIFITTAGGSSTIGWRWERTAHRALF